MPRQIRNMVALAGLAAWLALCSRSRADVPEIETFENDADSYVPNDDPVNDPNLAGSTPPVGDWHDARNGGDGVIEEVPSDPQGVSTSGRGGSNYGVVYPGNFQGPPNYTQGPAGHPARSVDPLGQSWSYQVDIHTDISVSSNNNGVPDFWWTNAVNNNNGSGYLTETGFTGEVLPNGEWRFTTTKTGQPSVNLSANGWYTLEVSYDTTNPQLGANLRIYNQAHTVQLYNYSLSALFDENNPPTSDQLGGPLYSWFAYFEQNINHLSVDNLGVGAPIELATTNVLGDINADGVFDSADINEFERLLASASQATAISAPGDINGDGVIDVFDVESFMALGQQFSSGGANLAAGGENLSLAIGSVPEPSSLVLIGLGGLGLLWRASRRRV